MAAPKTKKKAAAVYAVHGGRAPGTYTDWDDCKAAVRGGAKFKKFKCARLANLYVSTGPRMGCRGMDPTFPMLPHFTPNVHDAYSRVKGYLTSSYTRWSSQDGRFVAPPPLCSTEPGLEWVFTDGSLNKRTGRAKAGVFFGSGSDQNLSVSVPLEYAQSNQTAELYAVYLALKMSACSVAIFSDSEYTIKWVCGAYKVSETTANRSLIEKIQTTMVTRQRQWGAKNRVMLLKVPAHCGVPGNEHADALAGL